MKAAPHDGEMLSSSNMVTFIVPPPDKSIYPADHVSAYSDEDLGVLQALGMDRRIRNRFDQVVFVTLAMAPSRTMRIDLAYVDSIVSDLQEKGWKDATRNKIALSLKRLKRFGYLDHCPEDIFVNGIESKVVPKALRVAVFARDGRSCRHCGATHALGLDHILARSKGGETTLENLQVLCQPCNSSKGDR